MRALHIHIIIFAMIGLLSACKTDPIDVQPAGGGATGGGNTGGGTGGGGGSTGGGGGNPGDTALCFERDILPIFISNCAKSGCHDAASRQDGYVFTSYATVTAKKFRAGDASETELYEKITEHDNDDVMPPPPNPRLTAQQIGLIGRWINEGAKNTQNCAPRCDSTRNAFAADVQPLISTYCLGCHSTAAPSAGIALDNYAGVRGAALSGKLLGAIMHSAGFKPMPQGGSKLSDCNIAQIRGWVQAGAPNN